VRSSEDVEKLIRNAEMYCDPEVDQAVLNDLLHQLDKTQESKPAAVQPEIRRKTMRSPITKLAAAAVLIVGVSLGTLLFHSSSQITWADVLEQIRNVKTVSYLLIKQSADASSDRPDSFRTIEEEYLTKDGWQATWLWEGFSRFTADQVKIVGTEQLNGVETIVFAGPLTVHVPDYTGFEKHVKAGKSFTTKVDSGKNFAGEARVWVDSQSAIPLRLVIEYTDDKDIRHRTTFKDIQWNAE
jgi:hypothetical protein